MATYESLILNGTELNDSTNYSLVDLEITPPKKRMEWVEGADADGSALVRDPLFENRTITATLRVTQQSTTDLALGTKVGAIVDLLEECENQPNGLALVWTPINGTKSITFYALSGEIEDMPIVNQGPQIGWLVRTPVIRVRLECKPFGYGAEVTVGSSTSTNPLIEYTIASVTGDVPAEGRLIVTDNATQSRSHVEWGLQQRYYSAGVPRVLDQFGTDTIGSGAWAFDAGTGTIAVSGGQLVPSSTALKLLYRTDSAAYADSRVTLKYVTGASVAGTTGITARRLDANNFLLAQVDAAGTLEVFKCDGGAFTGFTGGTAVAARAASTAYWVRLTVQGNVVTAEHFTADPATGATAGTTVTTTLAGANATKFGTGIAGQGGIRVTPAATDWRYDDFRIDPLSGSTELTLGSDGALVTSGFAGTQTTRTGAYTDGTVANHVIRGTLTTAPVAVCGTGNLAHVGTFRVKARVWPVIGTTIAKDMKIRLTWKEGDGPLRSNDYATPPAGTAAWSEVDLGLITIPEKTLGTQRWTGQVEAYSSTAGDTLDVDVLYFIPTDGYGKARAPWAFQTVTAFTARDEFDQVAGNLNAKALPVGGTWATSGTATDLAVEVTGHTAQRATTSDAGNGRFAIASLAASTTQLVQVDAKASANSGYLGGPVARYVDANNWLIAELYPAGRALRVTKNVAGVQTNLVILEGVASAAVGSYSTMRLVVDTAGRWSVWVFPQGGSPGVPAASGSDTALATGGALASGQIGFRDINSSSTASTRNFDNFVGATPTLDAVVFSGRVAEIRHDSAIRQDSTGTYYGPIDSYRGSRFLLPPAGSAARTSRLAVKVRRNDIDTNPDDQIADSTTVQVKYTPRYLAVPR